MCVNAVRYIKIGDTIVEIDNNIAEDVVLLNEKGYNTVSSCGGHIDKGIYLINIVFDKDYQIQPPKYFKMNVKKRFTGLEFYLNASKPKKEEKYNLALQEFKRWVRDLPYIK